MNRKSLSGIPLALLLIGMLPCRSMAQTSPETTVFVDPPSTVDPALTPGSRFSVNVTVSDVDSEIGCYAWQVNMSWNPAILMFVNVTEGDFLKDQPEGTVGFSRLDHIEDGWVLFGWSTIGRYLGVKGSGTLATVEFSVVDIGKSVINIDDPMTYLLGIEEYPPPPPPVFVKIPSIKENGYFSNIASATIDIEPDTLNLRSAGRWITAYIEFPEDYNVSDIDVSAIKLDNTVSVDPNAPTEVGDYEEDDVQDLMVKFDRTKVKTIVNVGNVTLTITGEVNGIPFEGRDIIRIIDE